LKGAGTYGAIRGREVSEEGIVLKEIGGSGGGHGLGRKERDRRWGEL